MHNRQVIFRLMEVQGWSQAGKIKGKCDNRMVSIHEEQMKSEKVVNTTKSNVVEHGQISKSQQLDKGNGVKLGSKCEISKDPSSQRLSSIMI